MTGLWVDLCHQRSDRHNLVSREVIVKTQAIEASPLRARHPRSGFMRALRIHRLNGRAVRSSSTLAFPYPYSLDAAPKPRSTTISGPATSSSMAKEVQHTPRRCHTYPKGAAPACPKSPDQRSPTAEGPSTPEPAEDACRATVPFAACFTARYGPSIASCRRSYCRRRTLVF